MKRLCELPARGGTAVGVSRRSALMTAVAASLLGMTGCAHRWQRPLEPDGRFCYVFGKARKSICTVEPVPSTAADQEAKRFAPDPGALTVYVVRHRWGDGFIHVAVSADSSAPVVTVPESLVRMRLPPGRHTLTAAWAGKSVVQPVDGGAGDVKFVRLNGMSWAWGARFEWEPARDAEARRLALESRLIADVTLR